MLKGITRGDISPGENIAWEGEIENIPAVVPTKLGGGCKNMEVKYLLSVGTFLSVCVIHKRYFRKTENLVLLINYLKSILFSHNR